MPRERIVSPDSQGPEEEGFTLSLRPKRLDEVIGQRELREKLLIAIAAAKGRGEPLEHILFHGPPGLGKTTMAHVVAAEMGAGIKTTSGPALTRPADLVGILTNLQKGDVLFIDEIHRLAPWSRSSFTRPWRSSGSTLRWTAGVSPGRSTCRCNRSR